MASRTHMAKEEQKREVLSYRNKEVMERCAQRLGLSDADVEIYWQELMKFLALTAISEGSYSPSQQVDEVWHEFLLNTRDYEEFCRGVVGHFIHHVPSAGAERRLYRRTLIAMARHFGPLNENLWPTPGWGAASCKGKSCRSCKSCKLVHAGSVVSGEASIET